MIQGITEKTGIYQKKIHMEIFHTGAQNWSVHLLTALYTVYNMCIFQQLVIIFMHRASKFS